jgi:hypothetical protein
MNKIEYDNTTSLTHFMDLFTINRLERTIYFEENCTPQNTQLINSCKVVVEHLKAVWGIE